MTIEEIFSQIAQRMIEGLMTHSQLADYFSFLGLKGYHKCHIYHYFEENSNYKKIAEYYMTHYNRLLIDMPFKNPNVIPENQFQFNRYQVSMDSRKSAIKTGIERQVTQERGTKKFYEQHYQALTQLGEHAAAAELKKYIVGVDYELAEAEQMFLELEAINYDISDIVMIQNDIEKQYKKKLKEIEL